MALHRVRYAVVGLGHIAQAAVLPAFERASDTSALVALVSGNAEKRAALAATHAVPATYGYEDYDAMLASVDAVYLALPNFLHADYTVRAARAGVHVLCEKPMAVTAAECEQMIDACDRHGVKLMIAYRLQFEAISREALEIVRSGRLGEPRFFQATFSLRVRSPNPRTLPFSEGGGSLYDIGIYGINAARHLFQAEPSEVSAMAVDSHLPHLSAVDATTAAILRFGDDRLATIVSSFDAGFTSSYRVVGTKGDLLLDPAFNYSDPLAYALTIDGRTERKRGEPTDQFAAEIDAFSRAVIENRQPGASGLDGLQDVRVIEALLESARTGRRVALAPNP